MKNKNIIIAFLLLITSPALAADVAINLDTQTPNGIFANDNPMQVFAKLQNNQDKPIAGKILWQIETDSGNPLKKIALPFKLKPNEYRKSYCPLFDTKQPGFYRYTATITYPQSDKIKNKSEVSQNMIVGLNPEKINTPNDAQPDFDTFWNNAKKELSNIKPQYKITLQKDKSNEIRKLYLLEFKTTENLTVRGWLEIPTTKGPHPTLLRVPGYGENLQPVNIAHDMIVLSFNPRGHGNSDESSGAPLSYWVRHLGNKEKYYYKGAYLDCLRALDYLTTRKDVNAQKLAVWGASQGGGLSFAVASLDQRITLCIADVPFLCDFKKYFKLTHWDGIDDWMEKDKKNTFNKMFNTVSYFDTLNMAHQIKAPVVMGIGLQDNICPPATSFATYNKIKSEKKYYVYKWASHSTNTSHFALNVKILRKHFELPEH